MKFGSFIFCLVMSVAVVSAQTTQPAATPDLPPTSALELRATQAFNRGEYAIALPILQKLAEHWKDQPDRLGPVSEQIRVCEKNLAADKAAAAAAKTPARVPHAPPKPGQVVEIAIKDLGNFEYDSEHGGNVPADVTALTGGKFRLRGYMIPMNQAEKITQFALVPDLFACCFGQPPQLQHTIVVNCPPDRGVDYFADEIVVQGTLKVEEKKDEGFIISLFELDADSVKARPQ